MGLAPHFDDLALGPAAAVRAGNASDRPVAVLSGPNIAEEVVRGMKKRPGVEYTALWFSESGLQRALAWRDKLRVTGALIVSADLGYAESQFHWLGTEWQWHLLILAAFHGATAYGLRSRLVLCTSIAALAAEFCAETGPANVESAKLVLATIAETFHFMCHLPVAGIARFQPKFFSGCRNPSTGNF